MSLALFAAGLAALAGPVLARGAVANDPAMDPAIEPATDLPALSGGPFERSGSGVAAPQEIGTEPWPENWFTDLPAIELTGEWVFDPAASDPMLSTWEGREITYEINQQAAFIVLDFKVPGVESNRQRYRWDGTIQRSDRGGRIVEEAARWTNAGRMLEIAVRDWDPATPEERLEYRFTYEVRDDRLIFVQESDTGRTVWRFRRSRG